MGLGNTGSDIADALVGHASEISISHHHGAVIVCKCFSFVLSPHLKIAIYDERKLTDL